MAYSGGHDIWFLSNSFLKSNVVWPQQPPTEKVLKFKGIFPDSTQNFFFSKNPNKAEFNDMDDSEVLINLNGLNDLDSLISSKHLLILMVGSFLAPK